jgi:periplasmic divalent cation tolerance protein
MSPFILVLTSVSDRKAAEKMARGLVERRLAACVTVSALARSYYWWEGKVAEDEEFVLMIKTKQELYSRMEKRIREWHPYDLPEIIAVPLVKGYQKYLDWIGREVQS